MSLVAPGATKTSRPPAGQVCRYCLACGRDTRQSRLWRKNSSRIFRCFECGLGAAALPEFDPVVYYNTEYFHSQIKGGYPDYPAGEAVIRSEFRRTVEFLRQVVPSGKLIEIGCAYGFFLIEARAHYDVHGIEIVPEAALFARSRGLDVRAGPVTRALMAEIGSADVVVMFDVIEHLEDPREVLCLCGEYLRSGGAVILTTPDFGSLLARLGGRRWRNMTPPYHLWYFTVESLKRLAARAGLEVTATAHPWKRVPLAFAVQLLGRVSDVHWPRWLMTQASRVGIPVNLFDSMRIVLRKPLVPRGANGPH